MNDRWAFVMTSSFAALLLAGINLAFVGPDDLSAGPALVEYYEPSSQAIRVALGSLAVALAGGVLLLIQDWIGVRLVGAGASPSGLAIANRLAVVVSTAMLIAAAAWSVVVWNNAYYEPLSGELTKVLLMFGWLTFSFGMVAAAAMTVVTVFVLVPTAIPGWVRAAGFVLSAALLLSAMVMPLIALPVWLFLIVLSVSRLPAEAGHGERVSAS